jgi:hypothetical protein
MRSQRDPSAPTTLSEEQKQQFCDQDTKLQELLVTRNSLWKKRYALRMLKKSSDELQRDIKSISRQISTRRQIIYRNGLKTIRDSHFEKMDTILAEGIEPGSGLEKSQEQPVIRPDLASLLYPKDSRVSSTLAALQGLIAHATTTRSSTKNEKELVFKNDILSRKAISESEPPRKRRRLIDLNSKVEEQQRTTSEECPAEILAVWDDRLQDYVSV